MVVRYHHERLVESDPLCTVCVPRNDKQCCVGLRCCHVRLGWHVLPVGHAEVVGVPVQFASTQAELEELRIRYQTNAADLDKVRYVLAVQARQSFVAWAR